jgi:2-isopropylmalate synthase
MNTKNSDHWEVPYLPIDCEDIGQTYQAIIRINSQSGKGGVAYVLDRSFGIQMPKKMHPEFGEVVTRMADDESSELNSLQVKEAFEKEYLQSIRPLELNSYDLTHAKEDLHKVSIAAQVSFNGIEKEIFGKGNGPIAAFVDAINNAGWKQFRLLDYTQHAITRGSSADAVSFIQIERETDQKTFWGASVDSSVEVGGLHALVSAFNRSQIA